GFRGNATGGYQRGATGDAVGAECHGRCLQRLYLRVHLRSTVTLSLERFASPFVVARSRLRVGGAAPPGASRCSAALRTPSRPVPPLKPAAAEGHFAPTRSPLTP